jgi:hypothetical protein
LPVAGDVYVGINFGIGGVNSTGTLTLPSAGSVRTGQGAFGRSGSSITSTLADCSSDGGLACVTSVNYPAAYLNTGYLSARNIKRGIVIGGITGVFPSTMYQLPRYSDSGSTINTQASGGIMTDFTNFITQLTSAGSFEYWDSTGVRRTGSGDADLVVGNLKTSVVLENLSLTGTFGFDSIPNAWDIRYGVAVNGVPGRLKVNCRNMKGTSYDNITSPAVTGTDIWDTVEDRNYFEPYSTVNPWTDQYRCGYDSIATSDEKTWEFVSGINANALFKDRISGLTWTRGTSTGTKFWQSAITYCDALDHGTFQDWRLPTAKELSDAYSHGIYDLVDQSNPGLGMDLDGNFWSSSTQSTITTSAWYINLSTGYGGGATKTNAAGVLVLCVR